MVMVKTLEDNYFVGVDVGSKTTKAVIIDIEDPSFLFGVMNFMIEYTEHHFETEERYMLEYKYPEFDSHKAKHEDWLLHHIMSVDKKMGAFLSKRVREEK
jgi:hypothetical protein